MIKEIIIHIVGPVDGPKGNLSVIPAALSRSKRGAVTRRAVAQRRSRVAAVQIIDQIAAEEAAVEQARKNLQKTGINPDVL